MTLISERSDCTALQVQQVHEARQFPVRNYSQQDKQGLMTRITLIVKTYTGADIEQTGPVWKKCAGIMVQFFGGLAESEIELAFQLASVGRLDVNITAFSGKFSVETFGKVMAEYKKKRDKIRAEIEKAFSDEDNQQKQEGLRALNRVARAEIIKEFKRLQKKNDRFSCASEVPANWAEVLSSEKLTTSNPEIWKEVKRQVVNRFILQTTGGQPDITVGDSISCRNLATRIKKDPDLFPVELRPRAEIMYGKWLVFGHLATYQQK